MTNKTLNENIRELRQRAGLNQVEFAKKMGITKQCVSNWENDNVVPSVDMLIKLADFFKTSTDYLLGRTTEKMIDISELNEEQGAHIMLVVKDFSKMNKKQIG